MEQELLNQCLPHIKTVDKLIQFANYYNVKDFPAVQQRLFTLQFEELCQNLNLEAECPSMPELDVADVVTDPSSRKRSSSLTSGPAPPKQPRLDSTLEQDLNLNYEDYLDFDLDQNTFDQFGQGDDESRPYEFQLTKQRTFAKHATIEKIFKVKFNDQWKGENLADLHDRLHAMFEEVLGEARGDLGE